MSRHSGDRRRQAFCLNHGMDAEAAAHRWADTWSGAWPQRDAEAIAALYADEADGRAVQRREVRPLVGEPRSSKPLTELVTSPRHPRIESATGAEPLSMIP